MAWIRTRSWPSVYGKRAWAASAVSNRVHRDRHPSKSALLSQPCLAPHKARKSRVLAGPPRTLARHACISRRFPLSDLVLWLDALRMSDLGKVGGKNASLGEMIGNLARLGVSVPGGFATTAQAFQQYLEKSGVAKRIQERLTA